MRHTRHPSLARLRVWFWRNPLRGPRCRRTGSAAIGGCGDRVGGSVKKCARPPPPIGAEAPALVWGPRWGERQNPRMRWREEKGPPNRAAALDALQCFLRQVVLDVDRALPWRGQTGVSEMHQYTGTLAQRDNVYVRELMGGDSMCLTPLAWVFGVLLLYLIVRDGVTRGMLTAWKKRDEQRLKDAVKAEQAAQAAAAAKRAAAAATPPSRPTR